MLKPKEKGAIEANPNRTALVLAIIIIGAVLLRLPNINESLWWDETCYTFMELGAGKIDRLLFRDVHPPLYPLIMLAWVHLFGDATVTVRIPSMIFGLTSLITLFFLARDWFGKKSAWLATSLMALSPVHIWYSQENKNNMLLLMLTLLSVYMLNRAWQSNRRRDWILFNLSVIGSIWTNHFAVWATAAMFLWLWLQVTTPDGRSRAKTVLASSAAAALAFSPFALQILFKLKVENWTYLKPFTPSELYKLFLVYLSHGNTIRSLFPWAPLKQVFDQPWYYFIVDLFFIGLLLWGLARVLPGAWRAHRFGRGNTDKTTIGYSFLPIYFLAARYFEWVAWGCVLFRTV
jgi:uncharacterized membrane protein